MTPSRWYGPGLPLDLARKQKPERDEPGGWSISSATSTSRSGWLRPYRIGPFGVHCRPFQMRKGPVAVSLSGGTSNPTHEPTQSVDDCCDECQEHDQFDRTERHAYPSLRVADMVRASDGPSKLAQT